MPVDCGTVLNPDTVEAQIPERGHVWHHRRALRQHHGQERSCEQTNFDSYQILRMNEVAEVEVHIVRSQELPGGLGEAGTSTIIPAVTNAIFAATGKRLRKLPIDAAALKQSD